MTSALSRLRALEAQYDVLPHDWADRIRTPEERRIHMIQRAVATIAEFQKVLDQMASGERYIVGDDVALYTRWRDEAIAWLHELEMEA